MDGALRSEAPQTSVRSTKGSCSSRQSSVKSIFTLLLRGDRIYAIALAIKTRVIFKPYFEWGACVRQPERRMKKGAGGAL
jgi:hypothetical protein